MRSRVGVMGGTFDPIHNGHLVAASEAADRLDLDLVIFMPTGQPWQKQDGDVGDAQDRYLMTVLATVNDRRFDASRLEVDRPGPTYSVDTLRELREQLGPDVELFFITGADALAQVNTWRDAHELADLAEFVGVSRPGHELAAPDQPSAAGVRVRLLDIPALEISSSDCRRRVRAGESIRYLVPDAVAEYIAKRGLYAAGGR